MKPRHQRLVFVGLGLSILAMAAFLVLGALQDSVVFFRTPTELAEKQIPLDQRMRLGGLVEEGSVEQADGSQVRFRVTDLAHAVPVTYTGILPDLFREGQGVVVEGRMKSGQFMADQVLAKHDEKYMPPEAAEALKKSGQWQHMQDSMRAAGQLPDGTSRNGTPRNGTPQGARQ